MSIDNQDRSSLIKYRLSEARDTQADVEILISHNRLRAAINRIYYSMFYSLLALGLKYEFDLDTVNEMYEEMKDFNSAIEKFLFDS